MKKILILFVVTLLSLMASAYDIKSGDIYYDVDEVSQTAIVTHGENGYSGHITIPEYVGKYRVTSIGQEAFSWCTGLKSISIPNSVESICSDAFYVCKGLTSISIPNSVTYIGSNAFYDCEGLTSIDIPNSVTYLGSHAFDGTAWYDALYENHPNGVVYVGKFAYKYKGYKYAKFKINLEDGTIGIAGGAFSSSGLTSITIPNSVKSIGDGAFTHCSDLTSISIPSSVTCIGKSAFYGCNGLSSISIPSSVTSIGEYAFADCSGLSSISIPNNDVSIGCNAFSGTAWYDSQPDGVVYAGKVAYQYKGEMPINTNIILDDGTIGIADGAFRCDNLISITIPKSVKSISADAFQGNGNLMAIICQAEDVPYIRVNKDNGDYNFNTIANDCHLFVPLSSLDAYKNANVWSRFNVIRGGADIFVIDGFFYEMTSESSLKVSLVSRNKNVIIPEYVSYNGLKYKITSIDPLALKFCPLQSIIIGNGITELPDYLFSQYENIRSLTIGTGVSKISPNIFKIENYRWEGNDGFVKPVKTIWLGNTPPDGYKYAEGMVNYVANDSYTELSDKTVYNNLSSIFEIDGVRYVPVSPSERTCDAIDCVYDESVEKIQIGKTVNYKNIDFTVKQVHPYACFGHKYVKEVNLSFDGNLGSKAFYGCGKSISEVINNISPISKTAYGVLPITAGISEVINNISPISPNVSVDHTFLGTECVVNVNNTGYIGSGAFSSCDGLKSVEVGSAVGDIYGGAFDDCLSLTTAIINNKGDIGSGAFRDCVSLNKVSLGGDVTDIGDEAFTRCSSLQTIIIPNGVKSIGYGIFYGCSSLEKVQIGSGISLINRNSFEDCSVLSSLKIPQGVTEIGNSVFKGCTGLKKVIFENSGSELKLGYNGSSPLFSDCPLDTVYIGRNISYDTSKEYGYSPFYSNKTLRAVTIADKETEISPYEFYGCSNLINVKIGDGVKTIGDWAFSGCSGLESFAFGSKTESIGKEAFSDCTSLSLIVSRAGTPPTCGEQALQDINKFDCVLMVPQGKTEVYQAADQWKDFFFIQEGDYAAAEKGDTNGDGTVSAEDIVVIVNYIMGNVSDDDIDKDAADVNGDGMVNAADVVAIVRMITESK